jgi:hypothetical protein
MNLASVELVNDDNLHRIAIENLNDGLHALKRSWHKRWNQPPKALDDYTIEELLIESYEDYYLRHPQEADRFLNSVNLGSSDDDEWLERQIKESEREGIEANDVIKKYQTEGDEEMSDEECAKILSSVGKRLPGSGTRIDMNDEFEDTF